MYDNLNENTYYFLFLQDCRICPILKFYCKRARQQFWAKLSYLPHTTILFVTIACARLRKIVVSAIYDNFTLIRVQT